ncbi:hypothetical protein [Kribbella sp. NPDC023855]|uniref:hypothetical protein n=1 Tax=Kribbella sp. NPDC023855 TaxID=3154698 RepID=UPI0033DDA619
MYEDNTTDSDGRVSTLFHDTTTHLEPDVAALVQGSIERGQVRRRRNTIGTATVAAVAVAGIVGAAVNLTPNLGSAGFDPAGAPAGAAVSTPSAAPKPSAAPSAAPNPGKDSAKKAQPSGKPGKTGPLGGAVADIPVKAADLPGLFTQLYPGKVTPAEERTGRIIDNGKEGQYAHFLWKGFTTSVGFAAYAGTPAERCRELQQGSGTGLSLTCTKRPDGTALLTWRQVAPARDGGGTAVSASLLTKDGYEIFIVSYNSARKEGPNLAPKPPLSIAQLTAAVTSKVWF